MFYAIEYAYGSHLVNDGPRADRPYVFTARRLRDAWVNAGPPDMTAAGYRSEASARNPTIRKADYLHDGDGPAWAVLAAARVDASPALMPYRHEFVTYDWGDKDHARWVATAPERELTAWARASHD
jgi:hypothetical protein